MAAWSHVCQVYSNNLTVCVGATLSGRPADLPDVDKTIGLFINSVPMVVSYDEKLSVKHWLQNLQMQLASSNEHCHFPLAKIQKLSEVQGSLFESLVVFENYHVDNQNASQVGSLVSNVGHYNETSLPLTVVVSPAEQLKLEINYQKSFFSQQQIVKFIGHLESFCQFITQCDGNESLASLPVLLPEEQHWLQTLINSESKTNYANGRTLVEAFEKQAENNPDSVALAARDKELTYGEVDTLANSLALHLVKNSVARGQLVAICFERNELLPIAMLAIMKCGAAYLNIDPKLPQQRRNYLLEDSQVSVVITQSELTTLFDSVSEKAPLESALVLNIDEMALDDSKNAAEFSALNIETSDHDAAYVIYTSGSTGNPKGVVVPHKNVVALLNASQDKFQFSGQDIWTLYHSCSFDFSVWEVWGALFYGGRLVIVPAEVARDSAQFYQLLESHQVTVLNQTPSSFYVLTDEMTQQKPLSSLRTVIFGGEALDVSKLKPWMISIQSIRKTKRMMTAHYPNL